MSKRLIAMLAGVAALAVLVVGCGGGSDEESLTKAEFIKQADAICKEANDEVAAGYQTFSKEEGIKKGEFPDVKQGEAIAEDLYLPAVETRLEGLQELNPPEGEEEKIEAWLEAVEEGHAKAEKNIKLLFQSTGSPFEEANKLATAYGFKVCSAT